MPLTTLIILIYFLITLFASFLCRKRNTPLQRVLAAPQELGIVFMIPLIFSGLFGGSTITGTITDSFRSGISSTWYLIGTAIGCFVFLTLVFRFYRAMVVVKHSVSIPDAFGQRFDGRTKILMVLVIVVTNSIALSTIPLSTAGIISSITGLSYDATVWLCCAFLIVMALFSGMKGVAAMNIVHTIMMFLGLIILVVPCLRTVGGIQELTQILPESYFSMAGQDTMSVAAILLGAILAIITSPLAFMTVVSSDKPKSAKRALQICAILIIPFAILLALIGMCCKAIAPDAPVNTVYYDVAKSFSPVCYVFISMSILAATFSTAPASLLSIITTLNNDIFVGLIKKDATEKQQKLFVNLGVVILAVGLMLVGKNASSILGQLTGATQIKSVASLVLVVSLYWKRVDKDSAFITMLISSIVAMGWHLLGNPFGIQPLWPALGCTVVVLLITTLTRKAPVSEDYARYTKILDEYDLHRTEHC